MAFRSADGTPRRAFPTGTEPTSKPRAAVSVAGRSRASPGPCAPRRPSPGGLARRSGSPPSWRRGYGRSAARDSGYGLGHVGLPDHLAVGVVLDHLVALRHQQSAVAQELDAADAVGDLHLHRDRLQLLAGGVEAPPGSCRGRRRRCCRRGSGAARATVGGVEARTTSPLGSTSRSWLWVTMKVLPLGSRWQRIGADVGFCQTTLPLKVALGDAVAAVYSAIRTRLPGSDADVHRVRQVDGSPSAACRRGRARRPGRCRCARQTSMAV